jgi:hypothetical protein
MQWNLKQKYYSTLCTILFCAKHTFLSPLGPQRIFGSAPAFNKIDKQPEFSLMAAACRGVLPQLS